MIAPPSLLVPLLVSCLAMGVADGDSKFRSVAQGSTVELTAREAARLSDAAHRVAPDQLLVRYMRAPQCTSPTGEDAGPGPAIGEVVGGDPGMPACGASNVTVRPLVCVDGPPTLPLWRQARPTTTTPWTGLPWQMVRGYGCPEDLVPALTVEDFRRLPLPSPALSVQPARGWVLVNKETIVYTGDAPVTLQTDLLGYAMEVEATPSRFTYDFGDGSAPLTTASPGRPWPDQDTTHVYRRLGTRTITLTTTWTGRYRVAGSAAWHTVAGTATTSATSAPFEVQERRSHLVGETCNEQPDAPGCT